MKIVKASEVGEYAIEKMLTKASFDEVELSPKIREANKKTFGRDMTAAELVRQIVGDVRREGDAAVIRYTHLIDRVDYKPEDFLVTEAEYEAAEKAADPAVVESLRKAAENVRRYHQEQKPNSWMTYREKGSILGQSIIPLDRVGIYVTGGTARYYSVLNVETFMKRTSIISYTQPALSDVSEDIIRLAETEGLQAHANAIRIRREQK